MAAKQLDDGGHVLFAVSGGHGFLKFFQCGGGGEQFNGQFVSFPDGVARSFVISLSMKFGA